PDVPPRAGRRVHLDHDAAVAELRVVVGFLEIQDRAEADVVAAQLVHPLGHRLLAERRLEEGEDLVASRLRELIGNEILAPEVAAERAPEVRLVRPDGDEAPVARLVDVVARPVAGELLASALRKLA